MFGSDYMESTFSWLKSYRQRLDMFLPFSEHWPLPDSVRRKYYHATLVACSGGRARTRRRSPIPGSR